MCADNDSGDRPALTEDEIEVTPGMIDAGVSAVDPIDYGVIDRSEEVALIFRAMRRVALLQGRDNSIARP